MSVKCQKRTFALLFNHLVGTSEQRLRHGKAERLRALQVDDRLVLGWRLHWQISRLLALENAIDVTSCEPVLVNQVGPIRGKSASSDEDTIEVDGGQLVAGRQRDNQIAMTNP